MFDRLRTSFVPKIQSLTSKGIPKDVCYPIFDSIQNRCQTVP